MIWLLTVMNSKDFLKYYIEEKPDKVLNTQYIIISSTIKKMGKWDNVITARALYPSNMLLTDFLNNGSEDAFYDDYVHQLQENKVFFASIINSILDENYDIVILSSHKEDKVFKILDCIQYYIESYFKFPVRRYSKGKYFVNKKLELNKTKMKSLCMGILAQAAKEQHDYLESTEYGRRKLMQDMSNKDMKKILKQKGIDTSDLSKEDIHEYMEEYYINQGK